MDRIKVLIAHIITKYEEQSDPKRMPMDIELNPWPRCSDTMLDITTNQLSQKTDLLGSWDIIY
jgi:hypothetical protein